MDDFKNTLLLIDSDKLSKKQIVSILLLCVGKLEINTISGMANTESKTQIGIVEEIINFLEERSGFEDWWNVVDQEMKEEIKEDLRKILHKKQIESVD